MDSKITDEIIEELSSTLEKIETQSAAVLEFIKEKGIAKDEELAPYLERATAASSVRWRAIRVRIEYLLAGREKYEVQHNNEEESEEQPDSEPRSGPEGKQNDGAPEMPQRTKAANPGENQQSSREPANDVTAHPAPNTHEQEVKPLDGGDKQRNAA
ncbi:MAG TPA: hypothetical protein VFA90_05540 [Terriglobales bacterium]|nr:hypothetical protein [Terriglobales bacterium]